jgi:hypothetical protein
MSQATVREFPSTPGRVAILGVTRDGQPQPLSKELAPNGKPILAAFLEYNPATRTLNPHDSPLDDDLLATAGLLLSAGNATLALCLRTEPPVPAEPVEPTVYIDIPKFIITERGVLYPQFSLEIDVPPCGEFTITIRGYTISLRKGKISISY